MILMDSLAFVIVLVIFLVLLSIVLSVVFYVLSTLAQLIMGLFWSRPTAEDTKNILCNAAAVELLEDSNPEMTSRRQEVSHRNPEVRQRQQRKPEAEHWTLTETTDLNVRRRSRQPRLSETDDRRENSASTLDEDHNAGSWISKNSASTLDEDLNAGSPPPSDHWKALDQKLEDVIPLRRGTVNVSEIDPRESARLGKESRKNQSESKKDQKDRRGSKTDQRESVRHGKESRHDQSNSRNYQSERVENHSENAVLQSDDTVLQSENTVLQSDNAVLQSNNPVVQSDNNQNQDRKQNERILELEQELAQVKSDLAETLAQSTATNTQLAEEIQTLKADAKYRETKMEDMNRRMLEMQQENVELKKDVQRKELVARDQDVALRDLRKTQEEKELEIQKMKTVQQQQYQHAADLEKRLSKTQDENMKLCEEIKDLQREKTELGKQLKTEIARKLDNEERIERMAQELQESHDLIVRKDETIENLLAEKSKLCDETSKLGNENVVLRLELDETRSKFESHQKQLEERDNSVHFLQTTLCERNEEVARVKQDRAQLLSFKADVDRKEAQKRQKLKLVVPASLYADTRIASVLLTLLEKCGNVTVSSKPGADIVPREASRVVVPFLLTGNFKKELEQVLKKAAFGEDVQPVVVISFQHVASHVRYPSRASPLDGPIRDRCAVVAEVAYFNGTLYGCATNTSAVAQLKEHFDRVKAEM